MQDIITVREFYACAGGRHIIFISPCGRRDIGVACGLLLVKPRSLYQSQKSGWDGDAGGGTRTPDTRIMIPLL